MSCGHCRLDHFADTAAHLLDLEPVEFELRINHSATDDYLTSDDRFGPLVASPHLRAVRSITSERIYGHRLLTRAGLARLLRSPHLVNLKEVDLFAQDFGLEGVLALVQSPAPFRLRSLRLYQSIQTHQDAEETDEVVNHLSLKGPALPRPFTSGGLLSAALSGHP